jgi:fibronectin type 3 domain-containing protein
VIKGGKTYYSAFSSLVSTTTKPATPKITVKSTKSKQVAVTWKKATGASGYEVYRSTTKNGKYSKLTTTTKLTYTNTKLTGGKKYYYKVRAYRTVDGKKVYGSFSSAVYVTVKK